ncbi:MAG: ligase-associated DNA damage response exonuclease [Planctomycetota bacterium]
MTARAGELIRTTEDGLWCERGGFHIDPWRPVAKAIVTHAHADHTRPGSASYLCAESGEDLVRLRTQANSHVETLAYGERRQIGDVTVSLHPAGHVLGSAQIRVEHAGEVWVVAGDYKTEADPTCAPFEAVRCDVFVTESTFGLPVFRWPTQASVAASVMEWWQANAEAGRTSLLCAYALGKSQRLLAGLLQSAETPGSIAVHGALDKLLPPYRAQGIDLPDTRYADPDVAKEIRGSGLVIAPPSANGTPWVRKFGDVSTAFASGWMALRGPRRRRNFDHGFIVSDHADWAGLLDAIASTEAERVLVTHGYVDTLVRYLREIRGLDAAPLESRFEGEEGEAAETPTEETAEKSEA